MSNVPTVFTAKRTILAAVGALSLGALVPLTVAQAYPSGTSIRVGAVANPLATKPSNYTVTVTNGYPGCKVRINVAGNSRTGTLDASGTFTTDIGVSRKSGAYKLTAKTLNCPLKESVRTDIVVTNHKISGQKTVYVNKSFEVKATGWLPRTPIQFSTTNMNGVVEFSEVLTTNSKGEAKNRVRLRTAGPGTVVVSQGSKQMSFAVNVKPAR